MFIEVEYLHWNGERSQRVLRMILLSDIKSAQPFVPWMNETSDARCLLNIDRIGDLAVCTPYEEVKQKIIDASSSIPRLYNVY
jgi:hypothetical protein